MRFHLLAASATFLLAAPAASFAQTGPAPRSVAAFDVALYTAGANVQEASDTGRAQVARPEAPRLAGDHPCNVIVACTRGVGQALGARWVVMAKVSKTSNLIWLLTGQLINAATGEIVLDDSIELKGDPEPMIRAGVRNFAVRAAREVKQDGQAGGRTVGAHPSGARETLALELLRPSVIYTSDRSTRCLI